MAIPLCAARVISIIALSLVNPGRIMFVGVGLHPPSLPFCFGAASKGNFSVGLCLCLLCAHMDPSKAASPVPPADSSTRTYIFMGVRLCCPSFTL